MLCLPYMWALALWCATSPIRRWRPALESTCYLVDLAWAMEASVNATQAKAGEVSASARALAHLLHLETFHFRMWTSRGLSAGWWETGSCGAILAQPRASQPLGAALQADSGPLLRCAQPKLLTQISLGSHGFQVPKLHSPFFPVAKCLLQCGF